MPKIPVSFKQTTRDMNLYMEVKAQEEKSEFVKDAIEYYINYLNSKKTNKYNND